MKGFCLLILTVCASAVAFSQQIPSQIQAKKGVFTERLYLNGQWVNKISTDLSTADDSSNSLLTTGKAVTDFVRMHSIQSASVTADGDYIHNWNHKQLRIDSISRLRFDALGDDDISPDDYSERNTITVNPASTHEDAITLSSTIYNKHDISDSMMSLLYLSEYGSLLRVNNPQHILIAGPTRDEIFIGAYNRNYADFHSTQVSFTPTAIDIDNSDGNVFIHELPSVNDTATYKPLGIDTATGKIAWVNTWPSGAGANRSSFAQTSPVTVSGTTNETSIVGNGTGSLVIPASSWKPGKTYRVIIYGTNTVSGGGLLNFNLKLKLGNTTIATTTNQLTGISYTQFSATINFTCVTTGSTGTVYAFGNLTRNASIFPWNNGITSGVPNVATIDMTTDQTVNVTATLADTTNTVSSYIFTLEEIN